MLEDRDYMRQPNLRTGLTMTTLLTIVMVAVFALQCINDAYFHIPWEPWLALSGDGLRHGYVWQLITFQFLHGSLMHIAMNLLSFWWLGHFVENVLGPRRFLVAYFGCGAIGGLLQGILMIIFPNAFGVWVVGASAGVSGLLAIFALLERDSTIQFYFVLPIRAVALLWIWGGISLFFTLVPNFRGGNIAHAAHLGGLLAGVAWVKLGWHHDYLTLPWEGWLERWRNFRRHAAPAPGPRSAADREADRPAALAEPAEAGSEEVDAVLDKISARGINSLTARERAVLEAARKRMAQR